VRIDSGVAEGGEITVHYDPMIAKVIASAETRDLATRRLIAALRAFPILGVRTNVQFLLRILDDPRFVDGGIDTGFLDREGSSLANTQPEVPAFVRAAAIHSASQLAAHGGAAALQAAALAGKSQTQWDPWNK
jgi:acetyl/propionyl-CoA carboxylase alpha subunit